MRRIWMIGTLAWTAVILALTLSPAQPTDGGWVRDALAWLGERGLPAWVDYNFVEVAANVALFIPFGLLLALTFRRSTRSPSERSPTRSLSERSETKGPLWPTVLALGRVAKR